jgi:hypothetical protein
MGIKLRPIKRLVVRQLDLGNIDDPILIFGGAYSNLQATQALIEASPRLAASLRAIVSLIAEILLKP